MLSHLPFVACMSVNPGKSILFTFLMTAILKTLHLITQATILKYGKRKRKHGFFPQGVDLEGAVEH